MINKNIMLDSAVAFVLFFTLAFHAGAQTDPLTYQFVVRDGNGEIVSQQSVEVSLSIMEEGLNEENIIYQENHITETSERGIVHLNIGEGSGNQDFNSITWNTEKKYFVQVRIDNLMNTGYDYYNTSQILMVTPRIFSGSTNNLSDQYLDTVGTNVKALSVKDDKVYLTNGGVVELPEFFKNVNSLLIEVKKQNVSCHGMKDGSIDITTQGGFPPYSYQWSNGSTSEDINNLEAGNYKVYVTDSKGYTAVKNISIKEPNPLDIQSDVSNVTSIGSKNGSINLNISGGRPPYSFQWSTGDTTKDISGVPAGPYEVMVSSANKCSVKREYVIKEPIEVSFKKKNVRCYGESNGAVRVNIRGGDAPYRIKWSNKETGRTLRNLEAGKYYVSVRDSWGYRAIDSVSILQPYPLRLKDSVRHITGENESGKVFVKVKGGIPPYNFRWNTGDTTKNLKQAKNGVYSVTIEDDRGCRIESKNIFVYKIMEDPRDTQSYKVITIGDQVWMAENLNVGKKISPIQRSTDNDLIEKYCYNNNSSNCNLMGGLYTWKEAMQYSKSPVKKDESVQGICPDGWHIPTEKEWQRLAENLGGEMMAGNKMKNLRYWEQPNVKNKNQVQLNITGFAALPAGRIDVSGESHFKGTSTSFWSASKTDADKAWHRTITARGAGLYKDASFTKQKYSVRCIKD
jgi:uncharacterized protein (TIGR02145 family)